MVICQYFLQGRCYFGKNCRNQHTFVSDKSGKVHGGNQLNNVILAQISNEVIAAEKGKQWPLTCFAPIKDAPSLPGWHDVAPEEVRWIFYESHTTGSVNQAMALISHFYKNAEEARNALKHPKPETLHLLNDFLKGNKVDSLSSFTGTLTSESPNSTFRFDTALKNLFGGSSNSDAKSINIFAGSGAAFQSQNIFGNSVTQPPLNDATSNIFAHPQQSSQNIFSKPTNINQNIFSNCSNDTHNSNQKLFPDSNEAGQKIFQQQMESNIFSNNAKVFGSFVENSDSFDSTQRDLFQNRNSIAPGSFEVTPTNRDAGTPANASSSDADVLTYSKMEDLSEDETKAFTSATFTFGNIPLKPPPKQYC